MSGGVGLVLGYSAGYRGGHGDLFYEGVASGVGVDDAGRAGFADEAVCAGHTGI